MKPLVSSSTVLILLFLLVPQLRGQTVANFSGTWTLDTTKTSPGPGGVIMDADRVLRVTQNAKSITFATTYPGSGNFVSTYKYLFDGKVVTKKSDVGLEKTSVGWSADKSILTITKTLTAQTKDGPAEFVEKESYRLEDNGRTLMNEASSESKLTGKHTFVTAFKKK